MLADEADDTDAFSLSCVGIISFIVSIRYHLCTDLSPVFIRVIRLVS